MAASDGDAYRTAARCARWQTCSVRRLRLLSVALGVVLTVAFVYERDTDDKCVSNTTTYDGVVSPGGPQSADDALEGFLGVTGYDFPKDLADYERVELSPQSVEYAAGEVTISAYRQEHGWFIGSSGRTCSR